MSESPSKTTTNQAFPFDFSLHNQFQGEGLSVIYIVNNSTTTSEQQQLELVISQTDRHSYTLKGYGTSPPNHPGQDPFNLALVFRPGVLSGTTKTSLSATLQAALATAFPHNPSIVHGPEIRSTDGAQLWYIALQKDLTIAPSASGTPWSLSLLLKGISAAAGVGSRSTQVECLFSDLLLNNTGNPLSFSRSQHMDIINHLGSSHAPLQFGVVGKNALLNASGQDNALSLYFQTNGRVPLKFGPKTEIDFTFPYDTKASDLIHFGSEDQVTHYTLKSTTEYSVPAGHNNTVGLYTLTATFIKPAPFVTCLFAFDAVQLSGPDGMPTIQVTVRNLPGYWDSTFFVPIHKESSLLDGQLELGSALTKGHLGGGSRIDFRTGTLNGTLAKISIEEDWGLNLYGTANQPIKVRETDLLVPEGRLAINSGTNYPKPEQGDSNANEKLNVVGDTFLDGQLGISGDTGIGGALSVAYPSGSNNGILIGEASDKGNAGLFIKIKNGADAWPIQIQDSEENNLVYVDGSGFLTTKGKINAGNDIISKGRIYDCKGQITPVGAIIAFGGSNVPGGWLACDGSAINSQFVDLIGVVGNNTPDLRSRFIVGTGQGTGLNNYTKGNTGGEEKHTLSMEEMPSHQHFGWGEVLNFNGWGWPGKPHDLGQTNDSTYVGSGHTDGGNCLYGSTYAGGQNENTIATSNGSTPAMKQGSTKSHSYLPPYYALTYIIKC